MNEDNNNQEPNAASRMRQAGFDPAVQVVSHVRTTVKNGIEIKTVSASVGKKNSNFMKEISYTNEKMIGNGSFGVVYQATLLEENEVVAIKRVLQDRRFKNRELNIMVSLDHCNIVRLKYYFYTYKNPKEDIYLNLVLEFIPDTVSKVARYYMRQGQKMPMIFVKLYMYQLFRSLAYIHTLGICHRDIKPQNLLVNPMTGVLKLCDFGSAKHLVRGEMNVSYICSRYYRAPELIFGATDYTTKIDIWSAGCVFAELLLGYPIFSGESGVDQLVEIIKVLGTPSKEQIRRMNRHYTEFKFPKISANPWERVFGARIGNDVIDLVSRLLDYTPFMRLDPLKACTHGFFDELRNPSCKLPNDRELPLLFNFTNQELKTAPELNAALIPQHLHSQFSQYITHSQEQLDSGIDAGPSTSSAAGNDQDSKSVSSSASPAGVPSSSSSSSAAHNARFSMSPKQQHVTSSSTLETKAVDIGEPSSSAVSTSSMQSATTNADSSSTISTEPVTTATNAAAASSVITN